MGTYNSGADNPSQHIRQSGAAGGGISDAQEEAVVALCVVKALKTWEKYNLSQRGLLHGSEPHAETFGAWLDGHDGRRILFSDNTMMRRYRNLFGVAGEVGAAREDFLRVWPDRLRKIVERIDTHPAMAGLPEVELVSRFPERFEFAIQFVAMGM